MSSILTADQALEQARQAARAAAEAARAAAAAGAGPAQVLREAADAAQAGSDATIPMIATKGRASYLGERSAGHRDPGSRSSALLLAAAAETAEEFL